MHHIPKLSVPDDSMQMGETTLAEGRGLPLSFGHAYLTLLVCLSGSAHFTLNFKEHAVRRGGVMLLAEDTIALLNRRSRRFKVFFCLMPKNFAAEVAYPLPNSLFVFLHDHPHCVPSKDDMPLIEGWVALMRNVAQTCPTYQRIMLRNQLQNLFLKMAEQLPATPIENSGFNRQEMHCWRFWELIGKHCRRYRDVKFYADALNITPFYLSQLTNAFFNETPKGLIDRQVTLGIKALLSYSDLSIGRVAEELNFADASYLCRYFKRQPGVSLSLYRKHKKAEGD